MKNIILNPKYFFLILTSILGLGATSKAGLMIDVSQAINVSQIKSVQIKGFDLELVLSTGPATISLPENAIAHILSWVESEATGPFIVSMDGSLIQNGENYYPACFSTRLGEAMLEYDGYMHQLVTGSLPRNLHNHPLYARSRRSHPVYCYSRLIDLENTSAEAIWYRRLASIGFMPPIPIGSVEIRVVPGGAGFPVKLIPVPRRTFHLTSSFFGMESSRAWDQWSMDLPFRRLHEDLVSNWDSYRSAFKPVDEFCSIVEAYAILNAIHRSDSALWGAITRQVSPGSTSPSRLEKIRIDVALWPTLYNINPDPAPWEAASIASVGEVVETPSQARLAMNLILVSNPDYRRIYRWMKGIEKMAEKDKGVNAVFSLLNASLETDAEQVEEKIQEFFSLSSESPGLFRIRARGYGLLKSIHNGEDIRPLFDRERKNITQEFLSSVPDSLADPHSGPNPETIYSLLDDVYTTGLMDLVLGDPETDLIPVAVAAAIARVHFAGACLHEKGRATLMRHFHFRFLRYLANGSEKDPELMAMIMEYRSKIAASIGLTNWREISKES